MQEFVKLTATGVGPKDFEIAHAQQIFDLQKANPPKTWKLADDKYEVVANKIVKKQEVVLQEPAPIKKQFKSKEEKPNLEQGL